MEEIKAFNLPTQRLSHSIAAAALLHLPGPFLGSTGSSIEPAWLGGYTGELSSKARWVYHPQQSACLAVDSQSSREPHKH